MLFSFEGKSILDIPVWSYEEVLNFHLMRAIQKFF